MINIHFPSFHDFDLDTEVAGQSDGLSCVTGFLVMPVKVLLGKQLISALLAADVVIPGVLQVSVSMILVILLVCDSIVTAFVRFQSSQVSFLF